MMTETIFISFWNVENLFDTEDAERPEKIRKAIASDIKGWNDDFLSKKLGQLVKVIGAMNFGKGPDILGVCEVENKSVLEKLTARIKTDTGRKYDIAHADTNDGRGIDIAFLYDPTIASTSPDQMFQHWVVKRNSTRDLFQVNFTVDGNPLVLIGNHWPSRTEGQYESEPFRMTAGETLAYWRKRILEILGEDVAIITMGDFNDEPFNRSIMEYAMAINDDDVVLKGTSAKPYALNLMWPLLAEGKGTLIYNGRWNLLDQIIVSRGAVTGQSGWEPVGAARIEGVEIMTKPNGQGPRRFGFSPSGRDTGGFSDHYPISIILKKSGC